MCSDQESNTSSNSSVPIGELRFELALDLIADLIATTTNPRTNGGEQLRRVAAEVLAHFANALFDDSPRGASPSGMESADGAPLGIGDEHGQAVSDLDPEQDAGLAGDQPISPQRLDSFLFNAMNDRRMDLINRDDGPGAAFGTNGTEFPISSSRLRAMFSGVSSRVSPRFSARPPYAELTPPCRVLKPCTSHDNRDRFAAAKTLTLPRLGAGFRPAESRLARCVSIAEACWPGFTLEDDFAVWLARSAAGMRFALGFTGHRSDSSRLRKIGCWQADPQVLATGFDAFFRSLVDRNRGGPISASVSDMGWKVTR